jgi:hypothetical protein
VRGFSSLLSCSTGSCGCTGRFSRRTEPNGADKALPEPFASVLPKIKAKSRIPVLNEVRPFEVRPFEVRPDWGPPLRGVPGRGLPL